MFWQEKSNDIQIDLIFGRWVSRRKIHENNDSWVDVDGSVAVMHANCGGCGFGQLAGS
jgi:hypothetical protein